MIETQTLGLVPYKEAWQIQEQIHADVVAGAPERILFVQHPPVVTLGRRPDVARHLLADESQLAKLGVELVQSDRGGDITFHGPGQLVAYPIIRLIDHHLSVGSYVKCLERAVMDTLSDFSIKSFLDPSAIGVWTDQGKICAIGTRIRRGVTMHGLALNVTTDLSYFSLIVPCGLTGRPVAGMDGILGAAPSMQQVQEQLEAHLRHRLNNGAEGDTTPAG